MKIYSKGISNDRIDYIVERVLRAYVSTSGTYAIVVLIDDPRTPNELYDYFKITDECKDYISLSISPTTIVSGLEYIVANKGKRVKYYEYIMDFRKSFYEYVMESYESERDLTRAEAVRIIWKELYDDDNKQGIKGTVPIEVERLVNLVEEIYIENRMIDEFKNLIIKYAIYIFLWERRYSATDVLNILHEIQNVKYPEETLPDDSHIKEKFYRLFRDREANHYKKDPNWIVKHTDLENMKASTLNIQRYIYNELSFPIFFDEEKFARFFIKIKKATSSRTSEETFTTFLGRLLFVNYYSQLKFDKKTRFDIFLDNIDYMGDVSKETIQILETAVEVVLMLTLYINRVSDKNISNHSFTEYANNIHWFVFPVLKQVLIKGRDIFDVNKMLLAISKDTDEISKICKDVNRRMNEMNKPDYGQSILGSYYMFGVAEENDDIVSQYKNMRDRAKSLERSYWKARKKKLVEKYREMPKKKKKIDREDWNKNYQANMGIVREFLKYVSVQNEGLHNEIKSILQDNKDD